MARRVLFHGQPVVRPDEPCRKVLLCCCDPDYVELAWEFKRQFIGRAYVVTVAGATKHLQEDNEEPKATLRFAFTYGADTLYVVHHEDCKRWGGSCSYANSEHEMSFHEAQLAKVYDMVTKEFPFVTVVTAMLRRDGKVEQVEPCRPQFAEPANDIMASHSVVHGAD